MPDLKTISKQLQDRLRIARETVAKSTHLAAIPEAAAHAGQVASDDSSSIEELAAAFTLDAVLCAKLLKVANSALYGFRTEVSSIEHAATLLGRNVLRNVALAASMQALMPKQNVHECFSLETLWRHSIRTAGAACQLARDTGTWNPEEAFAAGLIHDLGMLVEIESDRKALATVIESVCGLSQSASGKALRGLEVECFGADHQEFGEAMCAAWGFPQHLCDVAGHHHDPMFLEGPNQRLAVLVYIAKGVSADSEHGMRGGKACGPVAPTVLECIGLSEKQMTLLEGDMLRVADAIERSF